LALAYEINSQAPERHLTLEQTKALGGMFVRSASQFFSTADGKGALTDINARLSQRSAQWASFARSSAVENAIDSEAAVFTSDEGTRAVQSAEQMIP
jgi:hypothetical protein